MIDPTTELVVNEKLDKEREVSDRLYAIKLVERIVFTVVSIVGIAVIGALIGLVIIK